MATNENAIVEQKVKINTFYKDSIILNGEKWIVKFTDEDTENQETNQVKFGCTYCLDKEIIIYWNICKKFKMDVRRTLWHETGHAWMFSMPSHLIFEDYNDTSAEAFEMAFVMKPEMDRIMKGYNDKIKKLKAKDEAKKSAKKKREEDKKNKKTLKTADIKKGGK